MIDGEVVDVGQPIAIRFDENIANRSAAEQAIKVTTTPKVEGAFYWLNNREVRWRPAQYWKPGTKVEVAVNTYGVQLGDGLFGQDNAGTDFTIGDQLIATADDSTKTLTVRRNGEVIKTMPISMGKDSTPTNNGTYIIGDRFAELVMDSSTYGVPVNSPNGYRTEVDFATQMSYSGIYVHGAPWSVGSQGYSNVSHGCLNVSTSNAQWFYENTKRGDIVEVVGTATGDGVHPRRLLDAVRSDAVVASGGRRSDARLGGCGARLYLGTPGPDRTDGGRGRGPGRRCRASSIRGRGRSSRRCAP